MTQNELKEARRLFIDEMELELEDAYKPEERLFYLHPSEDSIVLSHAMFWVLSRSLRGKVGNFKALWLLHHCEEEMLEAYLTEDESFPDLLHCCNLIYEVLPYLIPVTKSGLDGRYCRKLTAIAIVAGGYGAGMPEDDINDLMDDIDFYSGKVRCPKIEQMIPMLEGLVEEEMASLKMQGA